jgi:lysophospholipase L1-like esterase
MKVRVRNVVLVVLADAVAIALLELVAGVVLHATSWKPRAVDFGHVEFHDTASYVRDDELFWRLRPDQEIAASYSGSAPRGRIHVNRFGYRGPDVADAPGPDVIRLACLGGSNTFGWQVADDETYPHYLAEILNRDGIGAGRVEVVNAGIPGYSSFQGVGLLDEVLNRLSPRLVTLAFGANDCAPALAATDAIQAQRLRGQWELSSAWSVVGRSRIVRLASILAHDLKFSRYVNEPRVTTDQTRENLRRMLRRCREKKVGAFVIPESRQAEQCDVAREFSVPCRWLVNPNHPRADGQRQNAERIASIPELQRAIREFSASRRSP